ncbi:hypothetical protein YC2023_111623 [Brassica napus]
MQSRGSTRAATEPPSPGDNTEKGSSPHAPTTENQSQDLPVSGGTGRTKKPRHNPGQAETSRAEEPHQDSTRHRTFGWNPRSEKNVGDTPEIRTDGRKDRRRFKHFLLHRLGTYRSTGISNEETQDANHPRNPTPSACPSSKASPSHQICHHRNQASRIHREWRRDLRRREQNKGFDKDRKEEETSRWSKEEKRKGSSRRRPTEPPPSELKERGGCTRANDVSEMTFIGLRRLIFRLPEQN